MAGSTEFGMLLWPVATAPRACRHVSRDADLSGERNPILTLLLLIASRLPQG